MHRGTIDRPALLPDRERVGDGEGLAVTDHHAAYRIVGHPGTDPGVDAHAREADLVLRPLGVLDMSNGSRPLTHRYGFETMKFPKPVTGFTSEIVFS